MDIKDIPIHVGTLGELREGLEPATEQNIRNMIATHPVVTLHVYMDEFTITASVGLANGRQPDFVLLSPNEHVNKEDTLGITGKLEIALDNGTYLDICKGEKKLRSGRVMLYPIQMTERYDKIIQRITPLREQYYGEKRPVALFTIYPAEDSFN